MIKIILPIIIVLFDQLTKFIVEKYLYFKQIAVIDNMLLLTYVQNSGGAWGIFNNIPLLFIILVPIVVIGLFWYISKSKNKLEIISVCMIIGGALGNYIDRIIRGYVVDFIDFRVWPVFNVADIFVVVGGILLILSAILVKKDGK
jgi:signal peptidase II